MARMYTGFDAREHGFRFTNYFEYSLPLLGHYGWGHIVYGLCGGMCFAALDYYHAGIPIPKQTTVPAGDTPLYRYLVRRQLDSFRRPFVPLKVAAWMLRSDRQLARLMVTAELPRAYGSLAQGDPAVLLLVRKQGISDPTANHQVVALGYELDELTNQVTLPIYDPVHPGEQPALTMNLAHPDQGIALEQSTGEPLRGFFVLGYRPRTRGLA